MVRKLSEDKRNSADGSFSVTDALGSYREDKEALSSAQELLVMAEKRIIDLEKQLDEARREQPDLENDDVVEEAAERIEELEKENARLTKAVKGNEAVLFEANKLIASQDAQLSELQKKDRSSNVVEPKSSTAVAVAQARVRASTAQVQVLDKALKDMASLAGSGLKVRNMLRRTTEALEVPKAELKKELASIRSKASASEMTTENVAKFSKQQEEKQASFEKIKVLNGQVETRESELRLLLHEFEDTVAELESTREQMAKGAEELRHQEVMVKEVENVLADREAEMRSMRSDLLSQIADLERVMVAVQKDSTDRWKHIFHDVMEGGEHLLEQLSSGLDDVAGQHSSREADEAISAVRTLLRKQMTALHTTWIHTIPALKDMHDLEDHEHFEQEELAAEKERSTRALDPQVTASANDTTVGTGGDSKPSSQKWQNSALNERYLRQRDEALQRQDAALAKVRDLERSLADVKAALALEKAKADEQEVKRRKAEHKEQAALQSLNELRRTGNEEERRCNAAHREEKKRLTERVQAAEKRVEECEEKSHAAVARFRKEEENLTVAMDAKLSALEKLIQRQRAEKQDLEKQLASEKLKHKNSSSSSSLLSLSSPLSSDPSRGSPSKAPLQIITGQNAIPRDLMRAMGTTANEQVRAASRDSIVSPHAARELQRTRERTANWHAKKSGLIYDGDGSFFPNARQKNTPQRCVISRGNETNGTPVVVRGHLTYDIDSADNGGDQHPSSPPTHDRDNFSRPTSPSRAGSPVRSRIPTASPRGGSSMKEAILLGFDDDVVAAPSVDVSVAELMHRLELEKGRVKTLLMGAARAAEAESSALVRRHETEKMDMLKVMATAKETFVQRLKLADENTSRLKALLRQRNDEVRDLKLRLR